MFQEGSLRAKWNILVRPAITQSSAPIEGAKTREAARKRSLLRTIASG